METANSNITPTMNNDEVNILILEEIQFSEKILKKTSGHRLFRTRKIEQIGRTL